MLGKAESTEASGRISVGGHFKDEDLCLMEGGGTDAEVFLPPVAEI